MLAETPSRLERAREAMIDLCNILEKRGGHRVALVLCAARARLACPLTHDCDHLRDTLRQLDEAGEDPEIQAGSGDVSGTRLGAGLALALATHDPRFHGSQDVLLLSDGDDPARDGEWRQAAATARTLGIPISTVGLGDPNTASPVRLPGGPLRFAGREVVSRLEEAPLREIAETTHGIYVPARTRALPLGELYVSTLAGGALREESDDALPVYRQHYSWFLLPALTFLASTMLLGERWRRRAPEEKTP
jgi:Ca-activated chloride channel family protein